MKKIALLLALVAATVLIGMTSAQAKGTFCSDKAISSEMSRVDVIVDEWSARALVLVFLADEDGRPVCGQEVKIDTSRNLLAPDGDEDDIVAFSGGVTDLEGKTAFMLTPEGDPSSTTVFIHVAETTIGHEDGFSFSYNPY